MQRLTMASLAILVGSATAAERPAPEEPKERFAVLVHTTETGDEGADESEGKVPMSKVTDEVAKRIKDRKKWFILTEDPSKAEILVDVVNHTVNEQLRTRMETRIDVTGTRKELVDVQWVQEQHFLSARVDLPAGAQVLVEGSDTRQKGGTLKHAAEVLAENLEVLCKERYWELEAAR